MIRDFICNWFVEKNIINKEEFDSILNHNYLEKGYVNSIGFIELISSIEKNFNITFSNDDFSDDRIFTVEGLIEKTANHLR